MTERPNLHISRTDLPRGRWHWRITTQPEGIYTPTVTQREGWAGWMLEARWAARHALKGMR